jgi:NADP-dependent 3-hydroxy acid dehydrogenase YdfG
MTLKFLEKFERQQSSSHIVTVSPCAGLSFSSDVSADEMTFSFMNSISDHLKERKLHKKIKTTCVVPCFVQNGKFISRHLNK